MAGGFGMIEAHLRDKRILLVDDEQDLARMVGTILRGSGFAQPTLAHAGSEALALVDEARRVKEPFHLFVLDVMMPGHGRVRASLPYPREAGARLHARAFPDGEGRPHRPRVGPGPGGRRLRGETVSAQELVLRIAAVLRRCYAQESPLLELDASVVDFDTAEVRRADGQTAVLTAKEHEILSVLARNLGRIVTIDSLCEACWGTSFGYENSLMAHIRRLREKIEANPSAPVALVTVKGLGYKLNARR